MKKRTYASTRISSYTEVGSRAGLPATLPTRNTRLLLLLLIAFLSLLLPLGCSPSSGDTVDTRGDTVDTRGKTSREISLAHTDWEESRAIAVLTEVVLEDHLDYDVELSEASPDDAMEGVSDENYDAFQGVWLPGMEDDISRYGGMANLGRWYIGTTRAGLAVPDYMQTRNIRGVVDAGVETVFVLDPQASALEKVPSRVMEEYGLRQQSYQNVEELISATRPLYEAGEPFVMLAYSPNRMDLEFDLTYIEGEEGLAELNAPQTLETVARSGLRPEHPEAYALLNEITLTESQISSLEASIHEASSPREGAEEWVESRGKFVNLWLSKVRAATS